MDQLHLMRVYVAVAEKQGFAAAARHLNMSPPAVTRAVLSLEQQLGVRLLIRTTRHVRATDVGLRYLEDTRQILHDIELANQTAIGINSEPKGELSITAPVMFGQKHVMPVVVEYLRRYPMVNVNAVFLDRTVNLLEEGFDLGIRIGTLADSSMRAKKIGEVKLMLVASPSYLNVHGIPTSPADLKQHTLISSSSNNFPRDWQFTHNGQKTRLHIQPRLTVTTNQSAIDAAKAGLGITRAISYQVVEECENNHLVNILESFQPLALPIHIIHRESHFSSAKVRTFIDLMTEMYRVN